MVASVLGSPLVAAAYHPESLSAEAENLSSEAAFAAAYQSLSAVRRIAVVEAVDSFHTVAAAGQAARSGRPDTSLSRNTWLETEQNGRYESIAIAKRG